MITCETFENLAEKQWAVVDGWLSEAELQHLKQEAQKRWSAGQFQPAKVGRSSERQTAQQIRSDSTLWIDLKDPVFQDFALKIEALQSELNRNLFCGITDFECHFARYAEGQFYDEHIDQPRLKSPLHGERVISFVLYLNENWQTQNGGQLSLRHTPEEIRVEPEWGRLVLFRSDTIPHAVLPAQKPRWSLTGWFRRS